tara:strand:- start:25 stop:561 length:537 start_codon:yes stop_codon:yes gene_type:complete
MAGIAGKEGLKLINKFVKGTPKGKSPNYGKLKAELIKKRREKQASDAEKEALSILKKNDETATMQQKARQSASSRKKPVSLAGPKEFGGSGKSKLQKGLESVEKTKSPKVKKTVSKPMSAAKKKRVEEARKKGSGALIREGLSDIKAYGGKVTKKAKGGSVPKGVGCATRGYGKAMNK